MVAKSYNNLWYVYYSTEPEDHEQDKIIEKDAAGTIIGYKYLVSKNNKLYSLFPFKTEVNLEFVPKNIFYMDLSNNNEEPSLIFLFICEYKHEWINNSLDADAIPEYNNKNGIYAAKNRHSHILKDYNIEKDHILDSDSRSILVKMLLSGKVIENEYGYRAEHADIIDILT